MGKLYKYSISFLSKLLKKGEVGVILTTAWSLWIIWNAMSWSCVFSCSMSMFWGDAEARVFVQLVPVQGADMPCKRHGQPLQQPQLRKQFGNAQQVFQHIQPTWLQGNLSNLFNIIYKILFAMVHLQLLEDYRWLKENGSSHKLSWI